MPHQRVSDLEHSSPLPPLDRFPSLASFIASDPDHTLLVFKRFDKLAARNLLYLQSELIALQAQQDLFDAEDQSLENDDRQAKQCAMDWESFKTASSDPRNEKQKVRMKLMLEIRHKLKEYSKYTIIYDHAHVIGPGANQLFRRGVAIRKLVSYPKSTAS
jgi:hypothetical protein